MSVRGASAVRDAILQPNEGLSELCADGGCGPVAADEEERTMLDRPTRRKSMGAPLSALLGAILLLSGLLPALPAHATPVVRASSAGTKTVGHQTYTWGTVSGVGATEVWTEVSVQGQWRRSQTRRSDGRGAFTIPLTYAANHAGARQYRVAARTSAGIVRSSPFTLVRTPWRADSVGEKVVEQYTSVWGTMATAARRSMSTEVLRDGGWSRSQVRTADAQGSFAIPLTFGAHQLGTTTWRVVANTTQGQVISEPFTLTRIAPDVTVSAATAGTKHVGLTTNVWGTVDGWPGREVWTEVWLDTHWSRSQTRTSNAQGFYAIPLTYGATTRGTHRFRVGATTPSGPTYSPEVTITRTKVPTAVELAAVDEAQRRIETCGGGDRMLVLIGDSYTNGTSQDSGGCSRFPAILGGLWSAQSVVLASNGSGYTLKGGARDALPFPEQARHVPEAADTVVVFGSRNDMHDAEQFHEIPGLVRRTIEQIRENAPTADIVVIGPPWVNPWPNDAIREVNARVAEGVRTLEDPQVRWVDALEEGWFGEPDLLRGSYSRYISEVDKVHPNDDGHAYLAERIRAHLGP